jgi:hypothetical protein
MMKRLLVLLVAAACALTACGDREDPPVEPTVQPGVLNLVLTTPNASDRAVLLEITGPGPIGQIQAVDPSTFVMSALDGDVMRVMVVGTIASGALLRVSVPDMNRASEYVVIAAEVADQLNNVRADMTGYSALLRRP